MKLVILNTANKDNYFSSNYKGNMVEIKRMKDFSDKYHDKSKYIIYPLTETDYRKLYGHRFNELIIDKGCRSKYCAKYLKRSELNPKKHYVCKMSGRIRRNRLHKLTSVQVLKGEDIKERFDLYQEYVLGRCFTIDIIYNGTEILYYNVIEKSQVQPYFRFPNVKNHEINYRTSRLTKIQEAVIIGYVRELNLKNMGVLNVDMIGNKIIEVNFRPAGYLINRQIGIDFLNNYVNLFNNVYNSGEYKRLIPIEVDENLYTNPQPQTVNVKPDNSPSQPQIKNYHIGNNNLYILLIFSVFCISILLLLVLIK